MAMDCASSPGRPTHARSAAALLGLVCLLLLCLQVPHARATGPALVVLSGEQPIYQRFVSAFESVWPATEAPLIVQNLSQFQPERAAIILAVGAQASRQVLQADLQTPVLSTLLPALSFSKLLEEVPNADQRRQQGKLKALFLDQPLARQLQLIRQLAPDARRIATLLGPYSQVHLPALQALSEAQGLELNYAVISEHDNPLATLTPLVASSDAFLVLPDRSSFNQATARWILQLSYRQQIPVFAYSKSYTDAGALAALHSSPELIARQAAELLLRRMNNPAAWDEEPDYPNLFNVSLNLAVVRTLLGRTPDPVLLRQELMALENKKP